VVGFIIGVTVTMLFGSLFYLGFNYGSHYNEVDTIEEDKEEIEKMKLIKEEARRRNQGLNNIMDYDIEVALGRREQIE